MLSRIKCLFTMVSFQLTFSLLLFIIFFVFFFLNESLMDFMASLDRDLSGAFNI